MKKLSLVLTLALLQLCVQAQTPPPRPHILGIDHVAFYTTQPDGVKKLYADVLGLTSAAPVEPGGTLRFLVGKQWVGFSPAPDPNSTNRMDHVALLTDNIAALKKYLTAQGIAVPGIQGRSDHSLFFVVNDPEGHHIEFVERDKNDVRTALHRRSLAPHDPRRVSGLQARGHQTTSTATFSAFGPTGTAA